MDDGLQDVAIHFVEAARIDAQHVQGLGDDGFRDGRGALHLRHVTARDAVMALVTLGVKDAAAQAAVQKALERLGEKAGTSQLITQALQEV